MSSPLSYVNNKSDDIMSSGLIRLSFWVLVVVCIILITTYTGIIAGVFGPGVETYKSYSSGASQRHISGFGQPTQGVEGMLSPKQEVYYNLQKIKDMRM